MSLVMCCVSPVTCHLSLVTCHQRQQPQPQTLSLLNPPLCTEGWFATTDNFDFGNQPIYPKTFKIKM